MQERRQPLEWSIEAEEAIKRVPFFVRKRVRARVEEEARKGGKSVISLTDVRLTQKRYLTRMSEEIKGYQLETCFGSGGCLNRAVEGDTLLGRLEEVLKGAELRRFLETRVKEDLKHHHEFRVALADCPNACSQPQIRDMGVMGALEPAVTRMPCSICHRCEAVCIEKALSIRDDEGLPLIDSERCVRCGKCVQVCPTGTLATGRKGYRVQLGGKLGRHPRLAKELPDLYSEEDVLEILRKCIRIYKEKSEKGERFSDIFWQEGVQETFVEGP